MHPRVRTCLAHTGAAALVAGTLMAAGLIAPADAQPGHGHAKGHGKGHCRAFQVLGDGVTNEDGTTTATIYRGSREFGRTDGAFVLGETVEGVTAFTGTIVFTSAHGTVTAEVDGTLDTTSGRFGARSEGLIGTDAYAGVSGKLRVWGTQNLADGTFDEHLLAKLCVPKKKQH